MAANDDMLSMIQEGLNDGEDTPLKQEGDPQDNAEEVKNESPQEPEESNETNEETQVEPEAGEFDVSKYFDGFNSLDEVKETLQRATKFTPEVEQELESLRQRQKELDKLQEQVKSLKERQPFHKKEFYQLDKLAEEDPNKAAILTAYKFGDNSAESVLKLKMQLENPDLAEKNPGFFERQLRKRYPDFYSGDYSPDDVEYLDAKTEMEADANAARRYLDSMIEQVEVPKPKTEEEIKAEKEQFLKGWQPSFKEVETQLKKFNIPVMDEKEELKTAMEMEIPEKEYKNLLSIAANHIVNSGLAPAPENIKQAVDVARAVYLYDHQAEIFTKFANKILSEGGQEVLKKFNNPVKRGGDVHNEPKPKGKEASDVIFNDFMQGRKF